MVDVDSTVCEVEDHAKSGAAFGYIKVLGYYPILATRADTGEVLHARMRKGSATPPGVRGASSTRWWLGCARPGRRVRS